MDFGELSSVALLCFLSYRDPALLRGDQRGSWWICSSQHLLYTIPLLSYIPKWNPKPKRVPQILCTNLCIDCILHFVWSWEVLYVRTLSFSIATKRNPRSSKSEFVWKSCACFSIWVLAVFWRAGSSGVNWKFRGRFWGMFRAFQRVAQMFPKGAQKFRAFPEVPGCVFLCIMGRFGEGTI